jgi:hypothetical protein
VNVRLGDLEIELERLANGKSRIAVALANSGLPGSMTEASDAAVLNAAKQLIKLVTERA